MVRVLGRLTTVFACALTVAGLLTPTPAIAQSTDTVDVRLLAFNDFRGNLTPPDGSSGVIEQVDGSPVPAGGAAYLAAYVGQLRSQATNSLLYSVGDSWGPSALESSLFHGEPVVEMLNSIGVNASGIGNLELDGGFSELQRLQRGGCHPVDGCTFDTTYDGASFPMLAANLTLANGSPATLPFNVDFVEGIPVGVIGVLPRDAGQFIAADRATGLTFGDELTAIDRTADLLDFFGVKAITVLLHKGDESGPGGPDTCNLTTSAARTIAEKASPKVDVIFTAAGNRQYNCTVADPMGAPRAFMQGASNGRGVSVVDINIDRDSRDVLRDRTSSFNQIVTRDITPDPTVSALVDRATEKASAITSRQIGQITADIVRDESRTGESPLGNLVADSHLAASRSAGADVALTNAGGLRGDLNVISTSPVPGSVSFGEIFAVQPFGNQLQVLTMTGAQLDSVLEQQFRPPADGPAAREILAPSANLRYRISNSAPLGAKVSGLTIDGIPVDPAAAYRVAVNQYLADGGDNFAGFTTGTDRTDAGKDVDALVDYVTANSPIEPPATDRIACGDCY